MAKEIFLELLEGYQNPTEGYYFDNIDDLFEYKGSSEGELIVGNYRPDRIDGGDGNDTITGGGNNDTIMGGRGHDLLLGVQGRNELFGGDGNDTLLGASDADSLSGNDGRDLIEGGGGNDTITGGNGYDKAYGQDGDDQIYLGGFQHIDNSGNYASGGSGNDTITGGSRNDLIEGGADNDVLMSGGGDDTLRGGRGDDTLSADPDQNNVKGKVILDGGDGDDRITAGFDDLRDIVYAGEGDDIVNIDQGYNRVYGDEGNDTIVGGLGRNWIKGGDDNDLIIGHRPEQHERNPDRNRDRVQYDDTISGTAEDSEMIENLTAGHDLLWGGDGNDTIVGGVGLDAIFGGEGSDHIFSDGDGFSQAWGGGGRDYFHFGKWDGYHSTLHIHDFQLGDGEDSDRLVFRPHEGLYPFQRNPDRIFELYNRPQPEVDNPESTRVFDKDGALHIRYEAWGDVDTVVLHGITASDLQQHDPFEWSKDEVTWYPDSTGFRTD